MKQIIDKSWESLSRQYDWIHDMHGVPQDPVHHAEGDVAVHTQMVLQALSSLPEYQALDHTAQEILWMSALMHDIEKRSTTFAEPGGGIVSPGHAKKGAMTARHILFSQFNIPFEDREQIVNLVRYHGLPLWFMHKPDPQKAILEASLIVNTTWLAILSKADILGRICKDQEEMLERIHFFEAYCQEQQCWGTAYPFSNGMARFTYFHKAGSAPVYTPFDDTICEVTVLSGLPGMGKDRYISKHCEDLPVISLDNIRRQHKLKPEDRSANGWVAQQAREQARIYLRAQQAFVWNATNITLQMRSQLIDLLSSYRARIKLVYVEQPYRLWIKQNAAREHMVPGNILDKLMLKLEIPKPSEAHTVHYEVS